MLDSGHWQVDTGYRTVDNRYRAPALDHCLQFTEYWKVDTILDIGQWALDAQYSTLDITHRALTLGTGYLTLNLNSQQQALGT